MKRFINPLMVAVVLLSSVSLSFYPQFVSAASNKATTQTDPARNAEFQIMFSYVDSAPKMPTKVVKGSDADILAIKNLIIAENPTKSFAEEFPFMSSKSIEMFAQTPLLVSDFDNDVHHTDTILKIGPIKFYKGGQYATAVVKTKDEKNKKSTDTIILIKENGSWKLDYIQFLKKSTKK